jgi:hypothetical protein
LALKETAMIAKAVKGKGFRGALEYDLTKEAGHVLDTNMTGEGPRELAAEFGEIRKLRPSLGKAVLHVSLSAGPGEHFTDGDWVKIGQRYLNEMGLGRNQYIITRHTDTKHEHIHLLVNRIQFDGKVTSDSHDYRRHETLMREIERDLGLQQVVLSRDAERKALTKGEIEHGLRTGTPSAKQQLQQLCDAAMKDCSDFATYADRLDAAGVYIVPVTQLDGTKLSGLSYRLDGVMMKGSDLGKRYSPSGLAKHGVSYDKERDFKAVGRCIERSEIERTGTADRGAALVPDRERGAAGIDVGTLGAGDGRADRRIARDIGGDRAAEQGYVRTISGPDRESDDGNELGDNARASGRGTFAEGRQLSGIGPLRTGDTDRDDDRNARERILALAGTADRVELSGPEGSGRAAAARDLSLEAVQKQIAAMGADRYEIVLVDAKHKQERRNWNAAELLHGVAWLKRMNARGHDVFIAPTGKHGLVLLDDLGEEMVITMKKKGFEPAVLVQTALGRYQAWVKLSERPVSEEVREHAINGLKRAFGVQSGDAERTEFGRLAGFTCDATDKSQGRARRFVLVRQAGGAVAKQATAYLKKIREVIDSRMVQRSEMSREKSKSIPKERGRSR